MTVDSGQLPVNWKIKTLDELCDIARGGSPRPINQFLTNEPDGVNWIKISDASSSSKYIYETKEKIKPDGMKHSRLVSEGDFILSNSMSFGRPYIMRTSGCIHDGWLVLKDKSGLFDQDYLYYFLGSNTTYKQFDKLAAGSTVRNLNTELVRGVKVILPPLSEQKRIVAILDEAFEGIDRVIANTEKNLANSRELFQSILKSQFSSIKNDWITTTIGKQITLQRGFDITKKQQTLGNIPVVSSGGIKSFHDIAMAQAPGVVIGRKGTLGKVFYLDRDFWPHDTTLWVKNFNNNYPKFVYYFFQTLDVIKLDTGTANPALNRNLIHPIEVNWPPICQQEEITKKLDFSFAETQRLEAIYRQKIAALNELKQSILQKAFTGELTVRLSSPTTADTSKTVKEEIVA